MIFHKRSFLRTWNTYFLYDIVNFVQWTDCAFPALWIVIKRMEALNAFLSVPITFLWALTNIHYFIENLIWFATSAFMKIFIEILILSTWDTLFAIKYRSFSQGRQQFQSYWMSWSFEFGILNNCWFSKYPFISTFGLNFTDNLIILSPIIFKHSI